MRCGSTLATNPKCVTAMGSSLGIKLIQLDRSLANTIPQVQTEYSTSPSGMFGERGNGQARRIYAENPYEASKHFFRTIVGEGSMPEMSVYRQRDNSLIARCDVALSDGSRVTWRSSTRDGTPAVSIRNRDPKLTEIKDYQNVHFEKRK